MDDKNLKKYKNVIKQGGLTDSQYKAYLNIYDKAVQAKAKFPEVIASQWALESNYGKNSIGNNVFGVKAKDGEDFIETTTKEDTGQGTVLKSQKFKKYDSVEDAITDRLNRKHWAGAEEVSQTAEDYINHITFVNKYATDKQYDLVLKSMTKSRTGDKSIKTGKVFKSSEKGSEDYQAIEDNYNNRKGTFLADREERIADYISNRSLIGEEMTAEKFADIRNNNLLVKNGLGELIPGKYLQENGYLDYEGYRKDSKRQVDPTYETPDIYKAVSAVAQERDKKDMEAFQRDQVAEEAERITQMQAEGIEQGIEGEQNQADSDFMVADSGVPMEQEEPPIDLSGTSFKPSEAFSSKNIKFKGSSNPQPNAQASADATNLNKEREQRFDFVGNPSINKKAGLVNAFEYGGALTEFNEGGTHEENPLGGIPQGVSETGSLNLVEEGETKYNDYIFSNSFTISEEDAVGARLDKSIAGMSPAEASKFINKFLEESPFDKITRDTVTEQLDSLILLNEKYKAAKEIDAIEQEQGDPDVGGIRVDGEGVLADNFKSPMEFGNEGNPAEGMVDETTQQGDIMPEQNPQAIQEFAYGGEITTDYQKSLNRGQGVKYTPSNLNNNQDAPPPGSNPDIASSIGSLGSTAAGFAGGGGNGGGGGEGASGGESGGGMGSAMSSMGGNAGGYAQLGTTAIDLGTQAFGDTGIKTDGESYTKPSSIKPGNAALKGAAAGATAGAMFGPWGAAIGAVVGGVAGFVGGKKKQRAAERSMNTYRMKNLYKELEKEDMIYKDGGSTRKKISKYNPTGERFVPTEDYREEQFIDLERNPATGQYSMAKTGYEGEFNQDDIPADYMVQSSPSSIGQTADEPEFKTKNSILGNVARYAPAIGSAVSMFNKETPEAVNYSTSDFKYKPSYVDLNTLTNQIRQGEANTLRSIEGSGASAGSMNALKLAAGLSSTKAMSDAFMKAEEINRGESRIAQQMDEATIRGNVAITNAGMDANAQNRAAAAMVNKQNQTDFFENLGEIGTDVQNREAAYNVSRGYTSQGEYKPSNTELADFIRSKGKKQNKKFGGDLGEYENTSSDDENILRGLIELQKQKKNGSK